jgi:hypothetical protein
MVTPSLAILGSEQILLMHETSRNHHADQQLQLQPNSSSEYLVTAVIVEPRCHPALLLVLLQAVIQNFGL